MLISTRLIATNQVTWSASGGTLSADDAALTDRAPATPVALTWASGAQSTSTTVSLIATCAVTPRIVSLLGTDLPDGLKVELWGQRSGDASPIYDLGGNSQTQTITTFDDGSRGAHWILGDDLSPLTKLEIRLYNDVSGTSPITASEELQIGEIVIAEAIEVEIESDWKFSQKDPSTVRRTLASQGDRVPRPGYRVLTCTPAYGDAADARGSGLSGTSWSKITASLRRDPHCIAIVRKDEPQTTAIFGWASKIPDIGHLAGPYYQPSTLTIEEIPA